MQCPRCGSFIGHFSTCAALPIVTMPANVTLGVSNVTPEATPIVTHSGGRKRVYASSAERQRAYRERKRAAQ